MTRVKGLLGGQWREGVEPGRVGLGSSVLARSTFPGPRTPSCPALPALMELIIFFQTWYCRESRYLQGSMSMPGWMGSGSTVQKSLWKEDWAWWGQSGQASWADLG